jgi:hypothetical protein
MKKILASIILSLIIFLIAFSPDAQLRRPNDFYFEVAVGNVLNHSNVNKFGRNADVDSAAVEDIWDGGGTWSAPTVTQVYTFTSDSANDTSDGTGARTMQIYGLDSNGNLADETITLAGTFPATATTQYQMIHRMIILTAGSGGVNAGTIIANANTDGTVTAQINPSNNQTLMAIYKVPTGYQGCILDYYSSLNKAVGATATANVIIKAKPNGQVYQTKQILGLVKDGSSTIQHSYVAPKCFDPLTIIVMSADTNVDNVDVSAGFDMVIGPG